MQVWKLRAARKLSVLRIRGTTRVLFAGDTSLLQATTSTKKLFGLVAAQPWARPFDFRSRVYFVNHLYA